MRFCIRNVNTAVPAVCKPCEKLPVVSVCLRGQDLRKIGIRSALSERRSPFIRGWRGAAPQSSYRWRVLDSAGVPELVQPARDSQFGFAADIALIDFAVVADVADDARGPVFAEAEILA